MSGSGEGQCPCFEEGQCLGFEEGQCLGFEKGQGLGVLKSSSGTQMVLKWYENGTKIKFWYANCTNMVRKSNSGTKRIPQL